MFLSSLYDIRSYVVSVSLLVFGSICEISYESFIVTWFAGGSSLGVVVDSVYVTLGMKASDIIFVKDIRDCLCVTLAGSGFCVACANSSVESLVCTSA